ncbi:hypothetical protein HDU76_002297 [Blyttiomyces sp. JEL0837]|nr:hypothetical protein HDU76_002297 [Blyttiomyces sp. JEL0837]
MDTTFIMTTQITTPTFITKSPPSPSLTPTRGNSLLIPYTPFENYPSLTVNNNISTSRTNTVRFRSKSTGDRPDLDSVRVTPSASFVSSLGGTGSNWFYESTGDVSITSAKESKYDSGYGGTCERKTRFNLGVSEANENAGVGVGCSGGFLAPGHGNKSKSSNSAKPVTTTTTTWSENRVNIVNQNLTTIPPPSIQTQTGIPSFLIDAPKIDVSLPGVLILAQVWRHINVPSTSSRVQWRTRLIRRSADFHRDVSLLVKKGDDIGKRVGLLMERLKRLVHATEGYPEEVVRENEEQECDNGGGIISETGVDPEGEGVVTPDSLLLDCTRFKEILGVENDKMKVLHDETQVVLRATVEKMDLDTTDTWGCDVFVGVEECIDHMLKEINKLEGFLFDGLEWLEECEEIVED